MFVFLGVLYFCWFVVLVKFLVLYYEDRCGVGFDIFIFWLLWFVVVWLEGGENVLLGCGVGVEEEWVVFFELVLNGIVIYLGMVWEFELL